MHRARIRSSNEDGDQTGSGVVWIVELLAQPLDLGLRRGKSRRKLLPVKLGDEAGAAGVFEQAILRPLMSTQSPRATAAHH